MKERINKLKVQRTLIKLLTGTIAVSSTGAAIDDTTSVVPEVCDAIFSAVVNFNGIDLDLFLESEDVFEEFFTDSLYTDVTLKQRDLYTSRFLYLDVLKTNIEDLEKLPNLKDLCLVNYKYLTEKDKEIIGNLKLDNLTLTIDENDIMDESMYDTSFVNPKTKVIFNAPVTGLNELQRLYYYLVKQKYEELPRVSFPSLDDYEIEEIEVLQEKLENIVSSFGFDENTTDKEKILTITRYVTDKIEYDPFVANNADPVMTEELIDKYNEEVISAILDVDDGVKNGICCNYSGLESTLGYYSNVDIKYISGALVDKDNGHAWNEYEGYYIDPTVLDNNYNYEFFRDLYDKTNGFQTNVEGEEIDLDFYKVWYENIVLSDRLEFNIEKEDSPIKQVTYFKYDAAKNYNIYKETKAKRNVYISMVATLLLVVELYLEKKKKKKQ